MFWANLPTLLCFFVWGGGVVVIKCIINFIQMRNMKSFDDVITMMFFDVIFNVR